MLMLLANIYDQLNNMTTTNPDNEKENSNSSTQNDQILELTQEVQNMGKVLAAISEKKCNYRTISKSTATISSTA